MLGLQLFHQLALQRVRRDTRGVGHGGVDCGKRARREGEWSARRDGRAEEIATASAQDSWGESAGEHQARWWGGRQEDGSDFATGGVRLQIAPAPARAAPSSCDFLDLRSVIHESVSLCCAPLLQYGLASLQLALYTGCRDVHEETVRLPHGGARVIPRNISLTRPQLSRVLGRQEL